MKRIILVLVILAVTLLVVLKVCSSSTNEQNISSSRLASFTRAMQKGDTTNMRVILEKWEKVSPEDPELATSYFNYYNLLSQNSSLYLSTDSTSDGDQFLLADSTGKRVGSLSEKTSYSDSYINKGLVIIDKAIIKFPDRLDMRFGKIYVLGQLKRWADFTTEIIKAVNRSAINKNKWKWTENKPYAGGEKAFLGSLQGYQNDLYNTQNDSLLTNMQDIAQAVLKYYPNDVQSLSNISIGYIVNNKCEKALTYLLRAEKIAPHDPVILSNLSAAYVKMGNKEKAAEYFKLLKRFDK